MEISYYDVYQNFGEIAPFPSLKYEVRDGQEANRPCRLSPRSRGGPLDGHRGVNSELVDLLRHYALDNHWHQWQTKPPVNANEKSSERKASHTIGLLSFFASL